MEQATKSGIWPPPTPDPPRASTSWDPSEHELPPLDESVPAAQAPGRQPHTVRGAERVGSYDAIVMVTPENNTAPSASSTNAIDHLCQERAGKPGAYVGDGIVGAVTAVQRLRAQTGGLRVADIGPQVALILREDFEGLTDFQPRDLHDEQVRPPPDELPAWAQALRREASPALHPTA
ncbi:NADPH-dependent FMN reductase [Streptomyces aureus]|uniref:NADPH-dependent FMN reductase n=1 Tax=Streptomyces aureus TaxID=193461 RepID=UPI0020B132E5|nr:NAD(P)H-dependent oxidoreductase [Streptomyces aureus]